MATENIGIDPGHTELEEVDLEFFSLDPEIDRSDPIAVLQLSRTAKNGAEILKHQFPDIVFTSGRRDIKRQALAMASNVLKKRKWIEQTYKDTPQRKDLQNWVDTNPDVVTKESIAEGLLSVMNGWTDEEKNGFSRHMTGHAFDVRPVPGDSGEQIKKAISELPNLQWHTFKEGDLERWHAQFHPEPVIKHT